MPDFKVILKQNILDKFGMHIDRSDFKRSVIDKYIFLFKKDTRNCSTEM